MKKRISRRRPSAAMIVAIIALVFALAGGAYAASIGLSDLTKKAKNKTVGVGKLTYVTGSTITGQPGGIDTEAIATCPDGLEAIGGGVARVAGNPVVRSSHPTTTGWKALVNLGAVDSVQAVVACATSRVVTGTPPA